MPGSCKVSSVLSAAFLMLVSSFVAGQSLKDHLQKAERFYLRKDYENAIKAFEQAIALDPDDAFTNFKAGVSCLQLDRFTDAVLYLERAWQKNPDVDPDISYHLGAAYQGDHQYAKARKHFETLKGKNPKLTPILNDKIAACTLGDSLMKMPAVATVKALGKEINTTFSEVSPLLSSDGQSLIFTSNRSTDDYEIKSRTNNGDVYISRRTGEQWSTAEKISENINVRLNETASSLSSDGKTLFLYYEDGMGDIYTSTLEDGTWSKPVPLNRFINHPQYRESSACMSADGKRLYFSSNRPGGKGGIDLYVCELGSNGQWGRPANLGSTINTRKDEEFPFLHADGTTLYFSSNGHPTLGDRDIFASTLENGKWSKPRNLGYPVNTSGQEGLFVLSADGRTGYFSSRRDAQAGNADIYSATILSPPAVPPSPVMTSGKTDTGPVTILKGTVVDVEGSHPLQAAISLVDHAAKKVVSRINTSANGAFELVIPYAGNFGVTTERKGYLFHSMNIDLPAFSGNQQIETRIAMEKANVGSRAVLKNIFFDSNESALKSESLTELENLRDLLVQNPRWRVQINGHTDNVGQAEANRILSLRRAQAVVDYLIQQGIPVGRLRAMGFGAEMPLVSNDDESEGRQINRRTEIEIVESGD